jgi:membrane-associated phospholipid phosphatase
MRKILVIGAFLFFWIAEIAAQDVLDKELREYFTAKNTSFVTQMQFYTYLCVAQSEPSANHGNIRGAIAIELIHRFFPDVKTPSLRDDYAFKRAKEILAPYLERLDREEANPHTFSSSCWFEKPPPNVEQIAHWIPWNDLPTTPPPPPLIDHATWAAQFVRLRELQENLNDYQIDSVHKWARGRERSWFMIANDFMENRHIPPEKRVVVRASLMKGLYNGMIAEYEAKYLYCIPRPSLMDPTFKSLLFLKSPSYPSGQAIQATIAAIILSFFFPDSTDYWQNQAQEAINSRLWGGVHFPIDIDAGIRLGQQIAAQTLSR